jgi:Holliday junction resolvasome RuvABC ATP-dependent DNA helicase subunit
VTSVLGLPLVFLDGHGLRSRDRLFDLIDAALDSHDLHPQPSEPRSGVPVLNYPPFAAFVDEAHKIGAGTQESLLTMLEADDRSVLLDGKRGKRFAMVKGAAFLFATTRPAEVNRALRTRCTEINLQRYTEAEVALMVRQRFPNLPDTPTYSAIATIAACARDVPRIAFEMARDVEEEIKTIAGQDIHTCVRKVMNGRSIMYANGVTKNDYAYLMLLKREGRPLGESAIRAHLQNEIDAAQIIEDVEPFLFSKKLAAPTVQGRQLTYEGKKFLEQASRLEQGL